GAAIGPPRAARRGTGRPGAGSRPHGRRAGSPRSARGSLRPRPRPTARRPTWWPARPPPASRPRAAALALPAADRTLPPAGRAAEHQLTRGERLAGVGETHHEAQRAAVGLAREAGRVANPAVDRERVDVVRAGHVELSRAVDGDLARDVPESAAHVRVGPLG